MKATGKQFECVGPERIQQKIKMNYNNINSVYTSTANSSMEINLTKKTESIDNNLLLMISSVYLCVYKSVYIEKAF